MCAIPTLVCTGQFSKGNYGKFSWYPFIILPESTWKNYSIITKLSTIRISATIAGMLF